MDGLLWNEGGGLKQSKYFLPLALVNWRLDVFVFYYMFFKSLKGFIFCEITTVFYVCFKYKKTDTVITRCRWTMKREVKDANAFGIYFFLKT